MIVAIDGPAGAGKSTTARELARQLNWSYIDTGAMYRAIALIATEQRVFDLRSVDLRSVDDDVLNEDGLTRIARDVKLRFADNGATLFADERDVSSQIRTPEIGAWTSKIAALPRVRAVIVDLQREIARAAEAECGGAVLEGRDIQTVVFPDAEVKVFLTADSSTRSSRRLEQWNDATVSKADAQRDIEERDARDSSRETSPLRAAHDAVTISTDNNSPDEVVAQIVELVRKRR